MADDFLQQIKTEFACGEKEINAYSPLTLAYIGDAIYDLIIRTVVVERANRSANDLHKMAVKYVKAQTQAAMIMALMGEEAFLTEEETSIYKRGRNAKSYSSAKNATISDYRKATGFEALVGYLYLCGKTDRILELVKKGIELLGMTL